MNLKNDLLLRAARGEKTERTPVWMMRQAGRILPEYRAVREKAGSFIKLATTPEMAAEVTLQPVDLLGVDAAIIFSDILVIPEAMGLNYEMIESKGPFFPKTIEVRNAVFKVVGVSVLKNAFSQESATLIEKSFPISPSTSSICLSKEKR